MIFGGEGCRPWGGGCVSGRWGAGWGWGAGRRYLWLLRRTSSQHGQEVMNCRE